MPADNLFEDLKDVLQDFKDFLDTNVGTIRPAVQALAGIVPQINDLINELVDLMNQIKAEVERLDPGVIPGLEEVSEFTGQIENFLNASENLLPESSQGTVTEVRRVISVVGGLPSVGELKAEIVALIDAIVAHLNSLKA